MDAHGARRPSGRGEPARRAVNAEPELSQRQGAVLVVVERERDVVLGVRRRATLSDRDREAVQAFGVDRSEEHTSELQSQSNIVCRLLLEKKNTSLLLAVHHLD